MVAICKYVSAHSWLTLLSVMQFFNICYTHLFNKTIKLCTTIYLGWWCHLLLLGWYPCLYGMLIVGWWFFITLAEDKSTLDSVPIVTVLF